MNTQLTELEGTWEEIMEHAGELEGRRVKITVLPIEISSNKTEAEPRHSTLGALLKHAGKWSGDDLEECLQDVYDNRTKAKFD